MAKKVVVFIPGIMGSCLRTPDGKQIWPAPIDQLVLPYKYMNDLMRDELDAFDVIRKVSISEQYAGLVDHLGRCGFRESDLPSTLYVFPYDWRKDNTLAADGLERLIKKVIAEHGNEVKVTLVGHSMGGLVCRHFLESGRFTDTPAWLAVDRLVTLATPHRGAPLALTGAMGMEKRLFLNADQVRLLCSDPRYPSLYQLLPPQGEPFVWDEGNAFSVIDPYEQKVAASLNLSTVQLEAAKTFHGTLSLSRRPKHVPYFFFAGLRQRTVTTIGVRQDPAKPGACLPHSVKRLEAEDGGDGTVPVWSGSMTSVQSQPVGGEHSTIYRSRELRLTLSGLLGKPGTLAPEQAVVEVAVRDRVVSPSSPLHISLTFPKPRKKVDGVLRLVPVNGQGQLSSHSISYSGLDAENLSLAVDGPAAVGVYEVAFYEGPAKVGQDELFVQQK